MSYTFEGGGAIVHYYRVERQASEMDEGGGRIEVVAPVIDDGIVFQTLHDYGDERGMIVAAEGVVFGFLEVFDVDDEVVASHVSWNAENSCDCGRYVLNNGLVEAVL